MKFVWIAACFVLCGLNAVGQLENTPKLPEPEPKKISTKDLVKRSADHLMLQFGYAGWGSKPDSINVSGFNRSFNVYLLMDFPFKSNPKLSVALGLGVGTDNIYFKETTIDLINDRQVIFKRDTITQYKKYKLQTGYLELPLEFRYSSKPENMNSGFKFAIGAKVGTNIDGKTKAKVDLDRNGQGGYLTKQKDKQHFQGTRLVGTARVGMGNISIFGTYTITDFFKEGRGPVVRPWTIGLCLSGL